MRSPQTKKRVKSVLLFTLSLLFTFSLLFAHRPAAAQISIGGSGGSGGSTQAVVNWVHLDGYQIFQLAAPQAAIGSRINRVEKNLKQIRDDYLQAESNTILFTSEPKGSDNLPAISINSQYLLTVTQADATMQGTLCWVLKTLEIAAR